MALALVLLWGLPQQAGAGEPDKKREFVWGISAFNGSRYAGTFSPPEIPTIYLRAGEKHILTGSYTLVYYWPIDHEYKPDWAGLNEQAEGTLEVLDSSGQVIQRVKLQDFLLTSADTAVIGSERLLLGEDADSVYRAYKIERDAWLSAEAKYSNAMQEYWRSKVETPDRTDLRPPDAPADFTKMLVAPSRGFAVQVQPGTYQIQFRAASGGVIPESRRTVIGVKAQRESVGYTVIPEANWTTTETSNDPSQIIYFAAHGATVYLQPNRIEQYNAQVYARMENPQDMIAAGNRWIWVNTIPMEGFELEVWTGDRLLNRVEKKPYTVEQLPGSSLGYRVVPFNAKASAAPDFEAFEVSAVLGTSSYSVRLVDKNGAAVPGGERALIRASDDLPGIAYVLALMPLLGAFLISWQRRRLRARSLKALADAGE